MDKLSTNSHNLQPKLQIKHVVSIAPKKTSVAPVVINEVAG